MVVDPNRCSCGQKQAVHKVPRNNLLLKATSPSIIDPECIHIIVETTVSQKTYVIRIWIPSKASGLIFFLYCIHVNNNNKSNFVFLPPCTTAMLYIETDCGWDLYFD